MKALEIIVCAVLIVPAVLMIATMIYTLSAVQTINDHHDEDNKE